MAKYFIVVRMAGGLEPNGNEKKSKSATEHLRIADIRGFREWKRSKDQEVSIPPGDLTCLKLLCVDNGRESYKDILILEKVSDFSARLQELGAVIPLSQTGS